MDVERWERLCERLSCAEARPRFETLEAAYGERHRHYHTAQHIDECLTVFDDAHHLAGEPDTIEYALWLHDVIYQTRRTDNEARSADLAVEWLDGSAPQGLMDRIRSLVLVTRHQEAPASEDERLMLDVDLNVLGAEPSRYDEYEGQVRREYWWVPRPMFRRRRMQLLAEFARCDPLYQTEWFRERFEQRAKQNLGRAIEQLGG